MTELFIVGASEPGTTNEVDIILPAYTRLWHFRCTKVSKAFPDSFLALALQDLEANEIIITNPAVNPTAVSILYIILEQDAEFTPYLSELRTTLSNPMISRKLAEASRYLLVDELALFSNSNFLTLIEEYSYPNLVDMTYVQKEYMDIMDRSIELGLTEYIRYIFRRVPLDQTEFRDQDLVQSFIQGDKLHYLQLWVSERHIDLQSTELDEAVASNSIEIVQWLLECAQVKDDTGRNLMLAGDKGYYEIIHLLLQYQAYSPEILTEFLDEHLLVAHDDIEPIRKVFLHLATLSEGGEFYKHYLTSHLYIPEMYIPDDLPREVYEYAYQILACSEDCLKYPAYCHDALQYLTRKRKLAE